MNSSTRIPTTVVLLAGVGLLGFNQSLHGQAQDNGANWIPSGTTNSTLPGTATIGPTLYSQGDLAYAGLGSTNAALTLTPPEPGEIALQVTRNPRLTSEEDTDKIWSVGFSVDGYGRVTTDGFITSSGAKGFVNGKWTMLPPGWYDSRQYMIGASCDEADEERTSVFLSQVSGTNQWSYLSLDAAQNPVWGVHADGSMVGSSATFLNGLTSVNGSTTVNDLTVLRASPTLRIVDTGLGIGNLAFYNNGGSYISGAVWCDNNYGILGFDVTGTTRISADYLGTINLNGDVAAKSVSSTNGFAVGVVTGITTTWTNMIPGVITQRISVVGGIIVGNETL